MIAMEDIDLVNMPNSPKQLSRRDVAISSLEFSLPLAQYPRIRDLLDTLRMQT
jgi:hypothetical protein